MAPQPDDAEEEDGGAAGHERACRRLLRRGDHAAALDALDRAVRASHRRGDAAALARGYAQGGDIHLLRGAVDAACFCWTQGYVLALDLGDAALERDLHAKLARFGRMG